MQSDIKKFLVFLFFFLCQIANGQSIYDKKSVKSIMDKVNNYQLANPWTDFDDNWIRGTYYTGVMACYQATGDKKFLDQCDSLGNKFNWQLPVLKTDSRGSGANLLTFAQTWLESYMVGKDKDKIRPTISHLENSGIRNPVSGPLNWYYEEGRRYVDGLFTGPPALAMLYSITKEEKYAQWMDAFFWDVYGNLYDIEENLFYRDSRFFPDCLEQRKLDPAWQGNDQVTANGKKVIWSRGNGWALAGITRVLKYLPRDNASYKRYEKLFKDMAYAIKNLQSEEGFWYPNLHDPEHFGVKETSGTSFFIYGFAYGINNGILNEQEYLPVIEKAWKSVYESVSREGKVQWGQGVGDRPVMIKKEDSHEYVTGTFLLAASEVYKLKK
ncbi:MAG: glycoside hydrolase family 88 protein [Cyclobacteriaceae bacterium]